MSTALTSALSFTWEDTLAQTAGLISPFHKCSPLSFIFIFLIQPSENQFTIQMRSSISGKVWNSIKIQGLNGNESDGFAAACLCSFDDELWNRLLYIWKHAVRFGKHAFAWTLVVYDFISESCSGCVLVCLCRTGRPHEWLSVQIAERCALMAGIKEDGSAEIAQGLWMGDCSRCSEGGMRGEIRKHWPSQPSWHQ